MFTSPSPRSLTDSPLAASHTGTFVPQRIGSGIDLVHSCRIKRSPIVHGSGFPCAAEW